MSLLQFVTKVFQSPTGVQKRSYVSKVRKSRRRANMTSAVALTEEAVQRSLQHQCSKHCLNRCSISSILVKRKEYLQGSQQQRSLWIQQYVSNNKVQHDDGSVEIRWHIDGVDVCCSCWKLALCISNYKLKHFRSSIHGNSGLSRMKAYVLVAIAWLTVLFEIMCDKMPTRDEFHLPCYIQWRDIWKQLNQYLGSMHQNQISESYFTRIRKRYFPKVKAPKYTRQGKCDVCISLKEQRYQSSDPLEKKELQDKLAEHNRLQMAERVSYNIRAIRGQQLPSQYLSLIVDGMNTVKFPLHMPISKTSARAERIPLHIHGLIDNSNQNYRLYGSLEHWSHGSDFVIQILVEYLTELKEQNNGAWPGTLYLQVDNCWKENKNVNMLCFLAMLVERGWFNEIYLDSLTPGHTHENIDQLFSNFNLHYWKRGLQSPLEMDDFLEWSYETEATRPKFKMVTQVYNTSNWLEHFRISMKGHSSARSFKIVKDNNKAVLFYRNCCLDQQWIGLESNNSNGIILFKSQMGWNEHPDLFQPFDVDRKLINGVLNNYEIMRYLDTNNASWMYKFYADSTFYFDDSGEKDMFPLKGPWLDQIITDIVLPTKKVPKITVDEIQQHLLRYGITSDDIGSFILADVECNNLPFLVGKVVKVSAPNCVVQIYIAEGDPFNTTWSVVPKLVKSIPIGSIFQKHVRFTKKMGLKKKFVTDLQNNYYNT
jgi:hypothetical protein